MYSNYFSARLAPGSRLQKPINSEPARPGEAILTRLTTGILLAVAILIAIGAGAFFALRPFPTATSIAPVRPVAPNPPTTPPAIPPADCLLPGPAPVPPDGRTATAAEMKLGQIVIQNFVNQLEAYQACRNSQADHAAPTVSTQQKDTWIEQGNGAIDEANAIANAFSGQLRIFKARNLK